MTAPVANATLKDAAPIENIDYSAGGDFQRFTLTRRAVRLNTYRFYFGDSDIFIKAFPYYILTQIFKANGFVSREALINGYYNGAPINYAETNLSTAFGELRDAITAYDAHCGRVPEQVLVSNRQGFRFLKVGEKLADVMTKSGSQPQQQKTSAHRATIKEPESLNFGAFILKIYGGTHLPGRLIADHSEVSIPRTAIELLKYLHPLERRGTWITRQTLGGVFYEDKKCADLYLGRDIRALVTAFRGLFGDEAKNVFQEMTGHGICLAGENRPITPPEIIITKIIRKPAAPAAPAVEKSHLFFHPSLGISAEEKEGYGPLNLAAYRQRLQQGLQEFNAQATHGKNGLGNYKDVEAIFAVTKAPDDLLAALNYFHFIPPGTDAHANRVKKDVTRYLAENIALAFPFANADDVIAYLEFFQIRKGKMHDALMWPFADRNTFENALTMIRRWQASQPVPINEPVRKAVRYFATSAKSLAPQQPTIDVRTWLAARGERPQLNLGDPLPWIFAAPPTAVDEPDIGNDQDLPDDSPSEIKSERITKGVRNKEAKSVSPIKTIRFAFEKAARHLAKTEFIILSRMFMRLADDCQSAQVIAKSEDIDLSIKRVIELALSGQKKLLAVLETETPPELTAVKAWVKNWPMPSLVS